MDKRQNRPIVIKINGKTSLLQGNTSEQELGKESGRNKTEVLPKKQPDGESKENAAKMKNDAESQTAAAREEPFHWVLPENKEGYDFSAPPEKNIRVKSVLKKMPLHSKTFFKHDQSGKRAFLSALFIIFAAILVGTGFGLAMLHMVASDQKQEAKTVSNPVENVEENGQAGIVTDKTVYVIQGGVFSTEAAAGNTVKMAAERGVPAGMLKMEGRYFIFIGVADSMDGAKTLGNYFAGKGIDSYAKEMNFHIDAKTGLKKEEIAFLEEASVLFDRLAAASAGGIISGTVSADTDPSLAELLDRWNKINENDISRPELKEIKRELDLAVKKLSSHHDGSERLISVQQHLVNALVFYQKLS